MSVEGASETGPITPIENVKAGYHDWRYLSPRTDLGFRFVPKDHDYNDKEDGESKNMYGEDRKRAYTLVFRPPGWKRDFFLKDLLWAAPEAAHDDQVQLTPQLDLNPIPHSPSTSLTNLTKPKQYQILTRTDTLIVLSNGEKVNPEFAERLIGEHPNVRGVLAFGEGEVAVGVVVELRGRGPVVGSGIRPHCPHLCVKGEAEVKAEESEQGIFTYMDRANLLLDAHAQIHPELVVFTFEERKPLVRTDKGSVARKASYTLFEREIQGVYERMGSLGSVPGSAAHEFPMSSSALRARLHKIVKQITGISLPQNDSDMFEAGLDSLQASRVQRAILNQLRNSGAATVKVPQLEKDFCFAYPSVDKMVVALLSRFRMAGEEVMDEEEGRIRGMKEMVGRYRRVLGSYAYLLPTSKNGAGASADESSPPLPPPQGFVVLLTGSTGNLGCFLLARLAKNPGVSKVVCLNRACSGSSIHQRQKEALDRRGPACVSPEDWAKVVLLEADLTKVDFGLGEGELDAVRSFVFCHLFKLMNLGYQLKSVTHIIHNAWPVNFNLHLSSFEPHAKGLCHLVRLALLNAGTIRIIFASSIAVASRYSPPSSSTFPSSETPIFQVPEIPLDATHPAPFGYAQSKWVCEQLLESVNQLFGSAVRASVVRLGQITGTIDKGAWNEWEHVPLMVRTSQSLGVVPDLRGVSLSLPVFVPSDGMASCGRQPHGSPSTAQAKSSSTSYSRHPSNQSITLRTQYGAPGPT